MGNSLKTTKFDKHVIIVGFSYAGYQALTSIWDNFRVTVIDQRDYFEHVPTNIKCSVDPEFQN